MKNSLFLSIIFLSNISFAYSMPHFTKEQFGACAIHAIPGLCFAYFNIKSFSTAITVASNFHTAYSTAFQTNGCRKKPSIRTYLASALHVANIYFSYHFIRNAWNFLDEDSTVAVILVTLRTFCLSSGVYSLYSTAKQLTSNASSPMLTKDVKTDAI